MGAPGEDPEHHERGLEAVVGLVDVAFQEAAVELDRAGPALALGLGRLRLGAAIELEGEGAEAPAIVEREDLVRDEALAIHRYRQRRVADRQDLVRRDGADRLAVCCDVDGAGHT